MHTIIPLKELPIANSITDTPILNCKKHNLEVLLCESCGLAQLKDLIDPKELFLNYVYFSSNSETMLSSVSKLVNKITPNLSKDSLVIEIASNDGYLLKSYLKYGVKILGIDPARNIAKAANSNGIRTINEFFNFKLSVSLKKKDILLT